MKSFNKTLIAVSVALASTQTLAAGFQLNSQSATGLGRAFAGDAIIADNASVLSRNPAAMALFEKSALSVGVAVADVQIDVKDVKYATTDLGSIDDAGSTKLIPNFYYIHPIDDKFAVGFAAFSNFGTGTDTSSLAKKIPVTANPLANIGIHDLLGETEVTTVNFNTSVSYRINDMFSVGAGIDAIYGEGLLKRNIPTIPNLAGPVDIEADGWGFGGIVGAAIELDPNNRFGLSYRFSPTMNVKGDIAVPPALGKDYSSLDVPLADVFQFAGFHQVNPKFAVHYTAQFTQWGNFHQISLKDGTLDSVALKEYKWKDSWLFSFGGTYTINDQFSVRAGYMHDQGVVNELSSLSIPDSDRNWFTAGVNYKLNAHHSLDFGIALVKGEEVDLVEKSLVAGLASATTQSGATYYSVQYNYQF